MVFDIDLHHGNGTQAIAWSLNEEAYRAETEGAEEDQGQAEPDTHETVQPDGKGADRGNLDGTPKKLKVFYGSLHDILSYPCEVSYILTFRPNTPTSFRQIGWENGACPGCLGVPSWTTRAVDRKHPPRTI